MNWLSEPRLGIPRRKNWKLYFAWDVTGVVGLKREEGGEGVGGLVGVTPKNFN